MQHELHTCTQPGFQVAVVDKNLPANAGDIRDVNLISGSGRSPGERSSNPLQYSSLENLTERGAWRAIVHSVAKSQTRLKRLHATSQTCTLNSFEFRSNPHIPI